MNIGIISADYKALEAILLEYVERYGLTPSARQFFDAQQAAEAKKNVETFRVQERLSA